MNDTGVGPAGTIRRRLASLALPHPRWLVDRGAIAIVFVATLAALAVATLTRGLLVHQPLYDELLHVLAARGLITTGQPVIENGIYERAELYTLAVKWSMQMFGDNLVAARLPAWFSTLALAALTGAWATRRAGVLAGLAAAACFAVQPITIDYAVFARFYTLHALFVMVFFIALYESFARDRRPQVRASFVLVAAIAAGFAWHLQITTLIAIGAAAVGIAAVLAFDNGVAVVRAIRAHPIASGCIAVAAITALVVVTAEVGLINRFGSVPLWASSRAHSLEFYNALLSHELPLLWPLFPIAAVTAFLVDRRLAVFCTVTVIAALAVHSIAAQKDARYIYYVIPLMCVLWGCAAAKALEVLPAFLARTLPAARRFAPLLTIAFVVFLVANSAEGRNAIRLLLGREKAAEALSYSGEADWTGAVATLEAARTHAHTVVTSNSMKAIHYLGDYDIELNASIVPETESGEEFGRDPRTGRVAISTPESMQQVLGADAPVLVIVEREKLRVRAGVSAEVADLLDRACAPVALAATTGLVAWTCDAPSRKTDLSAGETVKPEEPAATR